jgi:hypothetical protein
MRRRVDVYDFLAEALFLLCTLVHGAVFLLSVNEMIWLTEFSAEN